ncbi:MAG: PepSY domain-containing protein, partial [Cellulomonadaceae bacterium]|nr:PepSY domain-containing protein [Cellulomonadaceae bacterium]
MAKPLALLTLGAIALTGCAPFFNAAGANSTPAASATGSDRTPLPEQSLPTTGQDLVEPQQITAAQALTIATAQIEDSEFRELALEVGDNGTATYRVLVVSATQDVVVTVDAATGTVLAMSVTSANADSVSENT